MNSLKALAMATLAKTATVGMMNMPTPSSSTTSGTVYVWLPTVGVRLGKLNGGRPGSTFPVHVY